MGTSKRNLPSSSYSVATPFGMRKRGSGMPSMDQPAGIMLRRVSFSSRSKWKEKGPKRSLTPLSRGERTLEKVDPPKSRIQRSPCPCLSKRTVTGTSGAAGGKPKTRAISVAIGVLPLMTLARPLAAPGSRWSCMARTEDAVRPNPGMARA